LIFLPPHKDREEESVPPRAASAAATAPPDAEPSRAPAAEPSLAEQVQKLLAEKEELLDTLKRRQADYENYRKRVEKERHQDRHRGVEALVEHLLPVLDAFGRALAAHDEPAYAEYRKGFELIYRQLSDLLAKQGLVRIESAGKEFNPHFHHAIERVVTSEHPDGTVIAELQPGYIFHNRVLRPAMVRVAAHPASAGKKENSVG
jgi:molecular chaperone GrpE